MDAWSTRRNTGDLIPVGLFEHFNDTSFIVETEDGDLAGFVIALVSRTKAGTGYIDLVWVSPELRGRGLAREMYQRVFSALRERGCTRVEAVTSSRNRSAIAFHVSLGFSAETVHEVPQHYPLATQGGDPQGEVVLLTREL